MNKKFDHPCKETCSGWQQGFEKGQEVQKAQGDHFTNEEHEKIVAGLKAHWNRCAKDYIALYNGNIKLKQHIDQMSCCCNQCTRHNTNISKPDDTDRLDWLLKKGSYTKYVDRLCSMYPARDREVIDAAIKDETL